MGHVEGLQVIVNCCRMIISIAYETVCGGAKLSETEIVNLNSPAVAGAPLINRGSALRTVVFKPGEGFPMKWSMRGYRGPRTNCTQKCQCWFLHKEGSVVRCNSSIKVAGSKAVSPRKQRPQ
jgi:hypothetical protein